MSDQDKKASQKENGATSRTSKKSSAPAKSTAKKRARASAVKKTPTSQKLHSAAGSANKHPSATKRAASQKTRSAVGAEKKQPRATKRPASKSAHQKKAVPEFDVNEQLADAIFSFYRSLRGLGEAVPSVMFFLHRLKEEKLKRFDKFLDTHATKRGDEKDDYKIAFSAPHAAAEATKQISKIESFVSMEQETPGVFLISLVSQYDKYLSNLLLILFKGRPEKVYSSEKSLTYSDLHNFSELNEAKAYIIEKEVESILRESHQAQFDEISKKFSVKLKEGLDSWADFIEVTERRNLFTHTGGKVSSQYLSVCNKNGADVTNVKAGDSLKVSQDYFECSKSIVLEIGVKLGFVLWRSVFPEHLEHSDKAFNTFVYELIKHEYYRDAIKFVDFSDKYFKKYSDEWHKKAIIINSALAHYLSGDRKKSDTIMDSVDWSASGTEFELAKAVLSEDYELATSMMDVIGNKHKLVNQYAYAAWPLFNKFRITNAFQVKYKEVFGEEFMFTAFDQTGGI